MQVTCALCHMVDFGVLFLRLNLLCTYQKSTSASIFVPAQTLITPKLLIGCSSKHQRIPRNCTRNRTKKTVNQKVSGKVPWLWILMQMTMMLPQQTLWTHLCLTFQWLTATLGDPSVAYIQAHNALWPYKMLYYWCWSNNNGQLLPMSWRSGWQFKIQQFRSWYSRGGVRTLWNSSKWSTKKPLMGQMENPGWKK